jgi:uncharacterized protein YegP (UPF0339 family)
MAAKFEISKDSANKFRFHLKAPSGEIIVASQGYARKRAPRKGLSRSRRTPPLPRLRTTRGSKMCWPLRWPRTPRHFTRDNQSCAPAT